MQFYLINTLLPPPNQHFNLSNASLNICFPPDQHQTLTACMSHHLTLHFCLSTDTIPHEDHAIVPTATLSYNGFQPTAARFSPTFTYKFRQEHLHVKWSKAKLERMPWCFWTLCLLIFNLGQRGFFAVISDAFMWACPDQNPCATPLPSKGQWE